MGSCGPLDVVNEPVQGNYLEMGLFDQVECSEVVSSQLFNCNRVESAYPILDKNLPLDPTCLFSNGFHDSSVVACDSRVDGEAPRVGADGIEDVKGEFVISALEKLPEVRYEDTGICLTGQDESDRICCPGSIDEFYLENDGSKFEDRVGNLVQDLEMLATSSSTVVQPSEGTEQTHHVDVDYDIDFLEGTLMGLRGVLDEREECLAGLLGDFLAHSPHLEESSRDIDGETLDVASDCTIGVSASFQLPVKSSPSRQLMLGDQETDEAFEDIMGNLLPNGEAPMAPSSSIAPHCEHTQDKYLMDGAENAIGLIEETTKNLQGVVEAGILDSLMNQKPHTEENSCDPAGGSVNIEENSLQVLCLSGDVNCSFSRQLAMDAQETDGVIGASSCSGLVDSTRHSVVVGRDTVENCSSTMVSSTRRITRQRKSNKMSESAKRTADQCRKTSKNMSLQGETIGFSFQVARRKRSFFSRRERSSIWGSLRNVMEVVTEYDEILKHDTELVQVKDQKTRKRRDNPRNKRSQKTQTSGKSLTSKEYNQSGQLRLKLKMGGKEDKRSPHAVLPEVFNSQVCLSTITSKCATESDFQISSEILKSDNTVMHKLDKNVCGNGQCTVLGVSDSQQGDKDLESTVTQENSVGNTSSGCPLISSEKETVLLDEAIDKHYPEAGTSPDSEVINSMQDAAIIPNAVLTSLEAVLGPIDTAVPDMELMRSKKGKKHGKVKGTTCLGAEDQLLSRINQDKTRKSTKKLEGKVRDGFNSIDSSSLATNGNTSSYSSNLKRQPNESPLLSEISKLEESLEVETSIPNYEFSGEDAGIKASESETTKGSLKSSKCMDPTRSSKSNSEVSKRRSRALDSARSRRKSTCDQKKKEVQKTISKKKIKEKGYPGQIVGKKNKVTDGDNNSLSRTKSHPESREHAELSKMKVVEPVIHDVPEKSTGTDIVTEDAFKSSMISSGLDGQLFPPRKAWVLCDDCQKWRCISALLADYIEETNCRWTCKENEDKAFADCSIPQEKTNAEINAELELSDVSGEEDAFGSHINSKRPEVNQSTAVQQAHWKPIVSNLFLHRSRKTQTIDEVMVCHCKPPRDGSLGCGDECLNRMLNIECVRGTCPCGVRCSNQQFQKRKYTKLEHFRCGKKGYGLHLLENVTGGKFLIEYVGEVLDLNAYEARQREYASRGQKHFYFMTLNGSEVIDACAKGNLGRFINHSCDPNCRTEKWMVNGEVCIGLFAIRDIKKGEEVTFDYNYVRVFGAAAKKCVCGSSECRGYIGGDPSNTEVIVQGDSDEEFPEPVMINEDGYGEDFLDKINIITRTIDGVSVHRSDAMVKSQSAIKQSEVTFQDDIVSRSDSAVRSSEVTEFLEDKTGRCFTAIKSLDTTSQTKVVPAESLSAVQHPHDSLQVEDIMSKTLSSTKLVKASSPAVDTVSESLSGSFVTSSKPISTTDEEKPSIIKASPQIKSSRSSSSVKKGKCRSHQVTASRSSVVGSKPKKMLEGALTNRLKGVEEKLNELLDVDGGISKRKDSTKGYLKLLLVTAASGDNVKGEAVQSTRDLSIILDALLKTRSRMVLLDIVNKNGLQMLHNIMKQNRRNFNKIPIIRKLLKVLTFLAEKEILTSDHMNSGPPCAGVESFKESIFQLARHNDMKVNQIARSFRDRWFPRTARRGGYPNRGDMKFESHGGVNCNRFSASCKRWRDEGVGPTDAICCTSQGTVAGNIQIGTLGHFTDRFAANGTKSRKRKSRWDQPAETMRDKQLHEFMEDRKMKQRFDLSPHPEVREVAQDQVDQASGEGELQGMLDDAPPGFSSPVNTFRSSADDMPSTTNNHSHHRISASEVNMGCHQERYHPHMPVSYGIPLVLAEQLGTAQSEAMDSWSVAPGIPFHPFPPLPPYPRDQLPSAMTGNEHEELQQSCAFPSQIARPPDVAATGARNEKITAQMRCSSGSLGRRFFKQQKPNNWKSRRPWSHKRMGENVRQNSLRSRERNVGLGNFEKEMGGFCCSEGVSGRRGENVSSTFRQRPEHHYDH